MTRMAGIGALALGALMAAGPSVEAKPVLEEVFPDGLPFPFEQVLERLTVLAGEDGVQTALIPLGRSLQRYSAAPDYFASPRLVVAVTDDTAGGPERPRLADRLYLGYQPAGGAVEAISFDEETGGFVFHEIIDYGSDSVAEMDRADPQICLRCHQSAGPIFARPLWDETNANVQVATRLSTLGAVYHGAPVRQSVDALDAFDAATNRAARIGAANQLWAEGCPDPACRAALFADAIRHGLGAPMIGAAAEAFREHAAARFPDGLSVVSPDLPNRDPMALLATAEPDVILDPTGEMDPETPRQSMPLWRPGPDSYAAAVRHVAAFLGAHDLSWIEQRLARSGASMQEIVVPCLRRSVALNGGGAEIRFACSLAGGTIGGFVTSDLSGRIELDTNGAMQRAPVTAEPVGGAVRLRPEGRPLRLPDGGRIAALTLEDDALILAVVADLPGLDAALTRRAQQGDPAFGPGPFRRRLLLRVIGYMLGNEHG